VGMHFRKLVEVYTSLMEYSCVVHDPDDLSMIASWKMPMELSVHQAAAIAALQTEGFGSRGHGKVGGAIGGSGDGYSRDWNLFGRGGDLCGPCSWRCRGVHIEDGGG
jgi:hypothetical protein